VSARHETRAADISSGRRDSSQSDAIWSQGGGVSRQKRRDFRLHPALRELRRRATRRVGLQSRQGDAISRQGGRISSQRGASRVRRAALEPFILIELSSAETTAAQGSSLSCV
jgi:hypothetical protein